MPSGVYKKTEEHKRKISVSCKGRKPWNKGLIGCCKRTEEQCKTNRIAQLRPEVVEKKSIAVKKTMSRPEVKEKINASCVRKSYEEFYGKEQAKEIKKKQSESQVKLWQDPVYREKTLRGMFASFKLKPTQPEKLLDKLLQQLFPNEYKYVGDGSVFIGFKNPDFINVIGQKKIIELFGDYWHGTERTGVSNRVHVQERKDHFSRYGYQTLVVWERELEDIEELRQKVMDFNKNLKRE